MVKKRTAAKVRDRRLTKMSLFFFRRPRFTAVFWLALLAFGIACYATLLGRQGFPPVHPPLSIVNGAYIVNDPKKVDAQITGPISQIAMKQGNVKTVTATANPSTFSLVVQYKDGTNQNTATQKLKE